MAAGGMGLGKEGQGCALHVTIHCFLVLDLLYLNKWENFTCFFFLTVLFDCDIRMGNISGYKQKRVHGEIISLCTEAKREAEINIHRFIF